MADVPTGGVGAAVAWCRSTAIINRRRKRLKHPKEPEAGDGCPGMLEVMCAGLLRADVGFLR